MFIAEMVFIETEVRFICLFFIRMSPRTKSILFKEPRHLLSIEIFLESTAFSKSIIFC